MAKKPRAKLGRKPIAEEDRRDAHRYMVSYNDPEFEEIRPLTLDRGVPVGTYARIASLEKARRDGGKK